MQISITNLGNVEKQLRLDPEPYNPTLIENEVVLSKIANQIDVIKLKNILSQPVITGHTPSIREPKNDGSDILFIKTDTLRKGFIVKEEADLISLEGYEKIKRATLIEGDIIVTIIGATYDIIGRAALVFKDLGKACINQNIALIRTRLRYPGFLLAFLNSNYGYYQLCRLSRQTEQVNLNCREIEQLRIPIFEPNFQKMIHEKVVEAHNKIVESRKFLEKAKSLLLSVLGLQDFKPKDKLSYEVSLSEANTVHRIDAEYFNPSYEEAIKKTKNYKNGYDKILNYAENIKPNFEPQKYPQKTFSYVELADINASIGVIQSATNVIGEEAPSRARRILKKNDVIVSSVEGSLEKVALVDEQFEGSIASTGFFQLRPRGILSEVLLILSKSPIIQTQLKKECAGTILTAVPKEAIKNIIIPILPKETQQKIVKLIQQSHESRRKAKQLLDEARRKVEMEIEKKSKKKIG